MVQRPSAPSRTLLLGLGSPVVNRRTGRSMQGDHSSSCEKQALWGNASPVSWEIVYVARSLPVDDALLERLDVVKGSRRIISVEQRGEILQALDAGAYQISPGGSMSNTMLALARLGAASKQRFGSGRMRAAFAAIAGSDPLGRFFLAQLQQAGLALLSNPTPDSNT
ncbi:hypothetical protein WJX84_007095, partial [Apatococcus fuscideae]